MMDKKFVLSGLMCAFLTACGGGGDDAPAPTPEPTPTAEGFWTGTASNGMTNNIVVLENGETWGVYGVNNTIYGALYGETSYNGTNLSGSGLDFNLALRTVTSGTYSGTFVPKQSISVTTSAGESLTGQYSATYDQPASLATLVGTFNGEGVSGTTAPAPIAITISSTGQISAPPSTVCTGSGNIAPRSSGKNIFDVSVTFQGTGCALGNGTTVNGIAYYDTSTTSLIALALNSNKSDGFIFSGVKAH